jgi:GT2 family glycosyltransferase
MTPTGPPWDRLPRERRRDVRFSWLTANQPLPPPDAGITLIEAGRNLGFAAANNLGMRFAAGDPEARFYWILNNDTVVAPDSLTIQRERMDSDHDIAMLGARLMFYGQPGLVQGLAGGFHLYRARGYHLGLGLAGNSLPSASAIESRIAYVLGASMFVRRTVVDRIGPMSEAYFLYYEEIDWARRVPPSERLAIAPEAVVWHKEGSTIGSSTKHRPSDTSLYYTNASLLRFYWRHHRLLIVIAVARVLWQALRCLLSGDIAAVRPILMALTDVARGKARSGRFGSAEFDDND